MCTGRNDGDTSKSTIYIKTYYIKYLTLFVEDKGL